MIKSVRDINVKDKTVLCRVDYNVPIKDGVIKDDTRIVRSLPTIKYLLENGALVVLTSHLGRPKKIDFAYSLKPVASYLSKLLGQKVEFAAKTVGEETRKLIKGMSIDNYRIVLLENTRFNNGETRNEENFSKELASLADIFVSDAFGTVHRAHASTVGVTRFLPGYAGFLVEEEYTRIMAAMKNPIKPSLAIIGGAKISTKLGVIKKFIDIVDTIILGGGMFFTFLKSKNYEIGNSLVEEEMLDTAKELMIEAKENGVTIILPVDVRLAKTFDEPWLVDNQVHIVPIDAIPENSIGMDIGPQSEIKFIAEINKSNTILWNGPMGVFEKELYQKGTKSIAKAVIERDTVTIVGGGDTVYALKLVEVSSIPKSIHVSTGGGATLELLSGVTLPGLTCLTGKIN